MEYSKIKTGVYNSLEKIGIYINQEIDEDMELENYIQDSLQYMSFIVELEQHFNVEIPDDLLLFEHFEKVSDVVNIISEIL